MHDRHSVDELATAQSCAGKQSDLNSETSLNGGSAELRATCPHCTYALGSNWRACERCREGMSPQPDAFELESMQLLVEKATTRIIQAQTALIARLTAENAELRRELGR